MNKIYLHAAMAFLGLLTLSVGESGEHAPPQRELKTYALDGNPNSANLSPDETKVATEITRPNSGAGPSKLDAVEIAQLWDFRQRRLIAEVQLKTITVPAYGTPPRQFARFTGDGKLVVVYLDHELYVLNADDLHLVRKISMSAPAEISHSFQGKTGAHLIVDKPKVGVLETSPTGHRVAAIWSRSVDFGRVDVYDVDSGKLMSQWNPRARGAEGVQPSAIAWESDGRNLVIDVPNTSGCVSPTDKPDVFVINAESGEVDGKFTSGLMGGGIAVTPDDRVWTVDSGCLGVFENHAPKMRVFDLHTGKRVHQLDGRGTGVRYAASASETGDRVVAFTGRVKVHFDWGDLVPLPATVDRTFSVWNSRTYEPIVTSQDVSIPKEHRSWRLMSVDSDLRISSKGRFVLFGPTIFELDGRPDQK